MSDQEARARVRSVLEELGRQTDEAALRQASRLGRELAPPACGYSRDLAEIHAEGEHNAREWRAAHVMQIAGRLLKIRRAGERTYDNRQAVADAREIVRLSCEELGLGWPSAEASEPDVDLTDIRPPASPPQPSTISPDLYDLALAEFERARAALRKFEHHAEVLDGLLGEPDDEAGWITDAVTSDYIPFDDLLVRLGITVEPQSKEEPAE